MATRHTLIALIALVGIFAVAAPAPAHQAITGWIYPPSCCGGQDCRVAEPGEVSRAPGGYRIHNTGEIFPLSRVRPSPDGFFHICQRPNLDGELFTPCLFVPALF